MTGNLPYSTGHVKKRYPPNLGGGGVSEKLEFSNFNPSQEPYKYHLLGPTKDPVGAIQSWFKIKKRTKVKLPTQPTPSPNYVVILLSKMRSN